MVRLNTPLKIPLRNASQLFSMSWINFLRSFKLFEMYWRSDFIIPHQFKTFHDLDFIKSSANTSTIAIKRNFSVSLWLSWYFLFLCLRRNQQAENLGLIYFPQFSFYLHDQTILNKNYLFPFSFELFFSFQLIPFLWVDQATQIPLPLRVTNLWRYNV